MGCQTQCPYSSSGHTSFFSGSHQNLKDSYEKETKTAKEVSRKKVGGDKLQAEVSELSRETCTEAAEKNILAVYKFPLCIR